MGDEFGSVSILGRDAWFLPLIVFVESAQQEG
jgi:hypothetical protein